MSPGGQSIDDVVIALGLLVSLAYGKRCIPIIWWDTLLSNVSETIVSSLDASMIEPFSDL